MDRKARTIILAESFTRPQSLWSFPQGTSTNCWSVLQRRILKRNYFFAFRMCVSRSATLPVVFSASVNRCIIGPKLMWQCKVNILGICCNPNNCCFL
jgi:hypothetical protein